MDLIGSGILVLIALVIGFLLGREYVKAQISAIEARYRAELECWKAEAGKEIRKDSVNRSRSTLKGKIAEQMAWTDDERSDGHLLGDHEETVRDSTL